MADDEGSALLEPSLALTEAALAGDDTPTHSAAAPAGAASASAANLPPLTEILHDTEHFQQLLHKGKKKCQCTWCGHLMPVHATKVMWHAARGRNKGVKICNGSVPKEHQDRYRDLYETKLGQKNRKSGEFGYFTCCMPNQIGHHLIWPG